MLWQGELREVTRCEEGERLGYAAGGGGKRAGRDQVRRSNPDLDPEVIPEEGSCCDCSSA